MIDVSILHWDGCPGCGDEGCIDETCYYCHSPLRPPNLLRLAQNLAAAAALCRSFDEGCAQGVNGLLDEVREVAAAHPGDRVLDHVEVKKRRPWFPGCGWGIAQWEDA